jgi:transcriptional regulator with XRE-family HTH domain
MSVNVRQTPNHHTWKQRSLGTAILQRRMELGLTQAALAERVATCGDWGFRQSDISRLERGIVTLPHFTRMRSLAAALELPVGELLAKSGWTGAEGAFPSDEIQRQVQGPTEPEDQGDKLEQQSSRPVGSSDEIQQLRQEIVQLREAVELLQKTLARNSVSFHADGGGRDA